MKTTAPSVDASNLSLAQTAVAVANLTRRFGDVVALQDVTLSIRRGEFFSLLGPSGCGKTTLLRIIAGLDFPDSGSLELGGANALSIPSHRRAVNTVFQSYALFPHLNVFENVAFGLRVKKTPRAEIEIRVHRLMEMVQIVEFAARKPAQLSGGQKQRVALARAIVNEPEVLLLDEPLGALDLKLRKELQRELHALQRRVGITFIYVTHDQDEALALSDRIAVMHAGRIVQVGTGEALYARPRNRFVAEFLGGCNVIAAMVKSRAETRTILESPIGELRLDGLIEGTRATLAIRPERIIVGGTNENCVRGVVLETVYTGAETHCRVRVREAEVKVTVMNSAGQPRLCAGESVRLEFPSEALVALEE